MIHMTAAAATAMDHCLAAVEVTGMDALLTHNKLIDSLIFHCTEAAVNAEGVQGRMLKQSTEWPINEAELSHARACVDKMVSVGKIPGRLTKAYAEMISALISGTAEPQASPSGSLQ